MEMINQKEYLKKYLGIGKMPGEKKKKKKLKGTSNRVKIIDDDAEVNFVSNIIEENPLQVDEDAPQIVAIIDERPPSLRVDEKTKNPLWQPIGTVDDTNVIEQKQKIAGFKIASKSNDKQFALPVDRPPPKKKNNERKPKNNDSYSTKMSTITVDDSPPRKRHVDDNSPPRKRTEDDYSPPRKSKRDSSPPRKSRSDDISPPRKSWTDDVSPPRKSKADDMSPPRKFKSNNVSPPRKSKSGDISPQRKSRIDDMSPPRKSKSRNDISPPRKSRNDISPPRKLSNDISPPRKTRKDTSPPRKFRGGDISPPRNSRSNDTFFAKKSKSSDISPPRKDKHRDRSKSPLRKYVRERDDRRKRAVSEERGNKKMEKTLDGKAAGLQNATELVEETKQLRQREDQLFKNLSKDQTGENAQTVFRDRKSGKVRNLEEEEERQRKKQEEEEKNKEKYSRWGRGLAQVESRDQKIQEELYEMSKPLARYADDEDLEKFLKEQEREGDPMLAYIRSKKRKKAAAAGEVTKPEFEGQFMPNRFGIKPGHRWDGVDRSNGYEKRWFEVQNAKRAQQEDVYKWSTEDM